MASAVATLKALVTADTKGFKAGMQEARQATSSFQNYLGAMKNAIAGAFSVGAVISYGRELVEWSGRTVDAAKNAGILTEEMMALNNVAIQSGLGVEKMQMILFKLQDQLDAAVKGEKKAEAAFAGLGLSLDDLVKMSPTEMLVAVARASTKTGVSVSALSDILGGRMAASTRAFFQDIATGMPELDTAAARSAENIDRQADKIESAWDRMKGKAATVVSEIMDIFSDASYLDLVAGTSVATHAFAEAARSGEEKEAEEKRVAAAKKASEAIVDEREKALQAARDKEIAAAQNETRKLVESRLQGIEKIKADSLRAEEAIIGKMKTADVEVKNILLSRLDLQRRITRERIAEETKKAQEEKNKSRESLFKDLDSAQKDVADIRDRREKGMAGVKGEGIKADDMARMGGFTGGYRPGFAAADRQIRLQEESNKYQAEMVRALTAMEQRALAIQEFDAGRMQD